MAERAMFGAIELGGTKIVLAIGDAGGRIAARTAIPTRAPASVLPEIRAFFAAAEADVAAIGVGAFGPIVIDPAAPGHGRLLETNKPGWSGFDLRGALAEALGRPLALVTDVGAAAIGEAHFGALADAPLGIYLTVGTGIGGAIVANGALLPAMLHPELGHIALQRRGDDHADSACRFHADCAEGLAAGPAIAARFGDRLDRFPAGGRECRLVADYLGQLCATLVLTLSPHRIVLGGGVAQTAGLIGAVHAAMLRRLAGYGSAGLERADFLCAPRLGQDAGVIGALVEAVRLRVPAALPSGAA